MKSRALVYPPLGATPSIVPSTVHRFLHSKWSWSHNAFQGESGVFKTTEFSSYLQLTALEAHNILNAYAADGLMCYAGKRDGIESWQVSKDGLQVFGDSRPGHRLTKNELNQALDGIKTMSGSMVNDDYPEVCVGGRAAFGKRNGQIVVGVLTRHAPFSQPTDERVLLMLHGMLYKLLPYRTFTVLLFSEALVPERLTLRIVITGDRSGETVVADKCNIDHGEMGLMASLDVLARTHGYSGIGAFADYSLGMSSVGGGPDSDISDYLSEESRISSLPIHCARSPIKFPVNVDELIAESSAQLPPLLDNDTLDYDARNPQFCGELAAELDYFAAHGEIDEGAQRVRDAVERREMRFLHQTFSDDRAAVLYLIRCTRQVIARERLRLERQKANRPKSSPSYFAFFDCLNFTAPVLAGFVRQPQGQEAALRELYDYWRLVIFGHDVPGSHFCKAGLYGGYLSLYGRTATNDEIAAFDATCKKAGKTFRFIAISPTEAIGASGYMTRRPIHDLPEVLQDAKMDLPVPPKVLMTDRFRNHSRDVSLKDAIEGLSGKWREHVARLIIDSESVEMHKFAASDPRRDLVRIGAQLDRWQFNGDGKAWTGSVAGENWRVKLTANSANLDLVLQYGARDFSVKLAPYSLGYGNHYRGKLSSLLPFMQRLNELSKGGSLSFRRRVDGEGRCIDETSEEGFGLFVDEIEHSLHRPSRYIEDVDNTSWPYFEYEPTSLDVQ